MSGGRPTDGDIPPAKKRGSARQLTKDDASEEEVGLHYCSPGVWISVSQSCLACST